MATFFSRSSKPGKLALGRNPGGGMSPTREPGGYVTSAALAAAVSAIRRTNAQRIRTMRISCPAEKVRLRQADRFRNDPTAPHERREVEAKVCLLWLPSSGLQGRDRNVVTWDILLERADDARRREG